MDIENKNAILFFSQKKLSPVSFVTVMLCNSSSILHVCGWSG